MPGLHDTMTRFPLSRFPHKPSFLQEILSLPDAETKFRGVVVPLPRTENHIAPFGVVGAVRDKLGLQADPHAGAVIHAALATGAVQEIAAVKLDGRLFRPHLHGYAW